MHVYHHNFFYRMYVKLLEANIWMLPVQSPLSAASKGQYSKYQI